MTVAQTPQTESLASWPVSEQAGGQVSKRAGTLTAHSLCFPLGFGSICYSFLLRRERSKQVKPGVYHPLCPACRGRAQGTGEQRGSVTLASEPVQGQGERLSWLGRQGKIGFLFSLGCMCFS